MRLARGLILLLALLSAAGAALLTQKAMRAGARPGAPAKPEMADILVAARAIAVGETVGADQVRWRPWPREALPEGAIPRPPGPGGLPPIPPSALRFALLEGEPISASKFIRPEEGSALAALLAPGMRAVSVAITEETAAGGFVQPGDRVDVVVARRAGEVGRAAGRADIVLRHVKVLAIGKTLHGKSGAGGRTATLELAPADAGRVIAAQSGGEIALALIGTGDVAHTEGAGAPGGAIDTSGEVKVMKYGRSSSPSLQQ